MKTKEYVELAKKMSGTVTYHGDEGHISFPTVWHKEQFENKVDEINQTRQIHEDIIKSKA